MLDNVFVISKFITNLQIKMKYCMHYRYAKQKVIAVDYVLLLSCCIVINFVYAVLSIKH